MSCPEQDSNELACQRGCSPTATSCFYSGLRIPVASEEVPGHKGLIDGRACSLQGVMMRASLLALTVFHFGSVVARMSRSGCGDRRCPPRASGMREALGRDGCPSRCPERSPMLTGENRATRCATVPHRLQRWGIDGSRLRRKICGLSRMHPDE